MKIKRFFALSLSLALAACQSAPLNQPASGPQGIVPPQPLKPAPAKSTPVLSTASKKDIAGLSTRLERVGDHHRLVLTYTPPKSFKTQAVDQADLAFVRLTVSGTDMSTKTSDLIAVTGTPAVVTIDNIPIKDGKIRVVKAEGFDADEQPIDAFQAYGTFRSETGLSEATVVVARRYLVLGQILEALIAAENSLANSLDTTALQTVLDELIFGNNTVGGSVFATDPLNFDVSGLTTEIRTNGIPSANDISTQFLTLSAQSIDLFLASSGGNPFGESLTVTVTDPRSAAVSVLAGNASPYQLSLGPVSPGDWDVLVKRANGTVVGQTTLVVAADGDATLGDGASADDPLTLSGVSTVAASVCTSTAALPANTLVVANCGGGTQLGNNWANAYTSLAEALDDATDGDDIWVAAGTYTPDASDRNASFQLKPGVDVYGGFSGGETSFSQRKPNLRPVLSGDLGGDDTANFGSRSDNSLHVIDGGTDRNNNRLLDGFVISGGFADGTSDDGFGAGLFAEEEPSLNINNCIFEDNHADEGGGGMYYASSGQLSISNTVFRDNEADLDGGGLYVDASDVPNLVNLHNVLFENNQADYGGGMYLYGSSDLRGNIVNSIFRANTANIKGGGLYFDNDSSDSELNITGTVFEDNVANGSNGDEGGGAIFFETNDSSLGLNIVDSVFRRNTVPNGAGRGGAIYAEQDSSSTFVFNIQSSVFYSNTANQGGAIHFEFTEDDPNWNISNSVFFKNIARQHGGAISINDESSANLDIMSCTFFDNHAGTAGSGNGGAIEVLGSNDLDLRIYNSIFWDNSSNDGDDDNQIFDDGNGSNIDLQNNIIEAFADDGLGGFGFVDNGGNLDDDPMFFSPNQLLGVDNLPGTADDGLRPTAVAINAGKTLVVEDVPDALQDIAGVSRPRGSAFDIGAFEVE